MTEFLNEFLSFYHVSVLLFGIAGLIILLRVLLRKRMSGENEPHLAFRRWSKRFEQAGEELEKTLIEHPALSKSAIKLLRKARRKEGKVEKKKEKSKDEQTVTSIRANLKAGKSVEEIVKGHSNRIYVLDFEGNILASSVEQLRDEITFLLGAALPSDEVVVRLSSPGGAVAQYGLASSQLARLRQAGLRCTVCVDVIAASGGYMMATVADRIVAAPFAFVGSIGVVAGIPNFHRVLQKNEVDYHLFTAGKHKRTVTPLAEITEEGREKFQADLEAIHGAFKRLIQEHRPGVDLDTIATGEYWLASKALELGLVDELQTSDDYLYAKQEDGHEVVEVRTESGKNRVDRWLDRGAAWVQEWSARRGWAGPDSAGLPPYRM
ncbi:MAG: protease SohB [SAR324 cluster bacterium]|jgi:serine protease SohB|nr:protease SohB [SAR324 cluster bacterium]